MGNRQRPNVRSLPELLEIVGALRDLPVTGQGVVECYNEGAITAAEARVLEMHARRSWPAQKRALAEARRYAGRTEDEVRAKLDRDTAKLRAKLDAQARRLGVDL